MEKSFAEMTHAERIAALMRIVGTPKGGATTLALLDHIQQETKEVENVYQIHLVMSGHAAPTQDKQNESPSTKPQGAPITIADASAIYKTHPLSSYSKLPAKTRDSYDSHMRKIIETAGERRIADLKEPDILSLYQEWAGGPRGKKMPMARAVARHLRMMMNFVAAKSEDADCLRLAHLTRQIPLPRPNATDREPITAEQVADFIREAHARGAHSMALAQALQFDCNLSQIDVRGEWVPLNEPGWSDEFHHAKNGPIKWVRGLKWNQIDSDLILRHTPTDNRLSNRGEQKIDLKSKPLVSVELTRLKPLPTTMRPMIVCEATKRPWTANEFRKAWRKIADAAGIPKNVTNGSRVDDDEDEDTERAAEVGSAAR
jgi:hypothetical protein